VWLSVDLTASVKDLKWLGVVCRFIGILCSGFGCLFKNFDLDLVRCGLVVSRKRRCEVVAGMI
jgi:hypothetical protein